MAKTTIPPDVRADLEKQERMYRCVVADKECSGRIQWHHAVLFENRSLQVWWAIHGICDHHHEIADRPDIRKKIVKVMYELGGKDVEKYEKIKKL